MAEGEAEGVAEGEAEEGREVGEESAEAVAQACAAAEEFLEAVLADGGEATAFDGGALGGGQHPFGGVEKHGVGVAVGCEPPAFGGADGLGTFAPDITDHAVDNVEHVEAGAAKGVDNARGMLTVEICERGSQDYSPGINHKPIGNIEILVVNTP